MKQIKLLQLILRNFKGCGNFSFVPDGKNCAIFGDNATGKTTLYDAFCWLLFDKDSQGKKAFEVKTIDARGSHIHGLEHEVCAVLDIDGKSLKLQKVFTEKWTKKRGSATSEFTGHTTNYFVDGVPVNLRDYQSAVNKIAEESLFKLLVSPTYFSEQLAWQERRKILVEVCGDVSENDVISSNPELKELPAILAGRNLEDHRKVIATERKKINEELEKIPVRIDEATRSLPDVIGISTQSEEKAMLVTLEAALKAENEALAKIEAGAAGDKQAELTMLEAEATKFRSEHRSGIQSKIDAMKSKLAEKENTLIRIDNKSLGCERKTSEIKAIIVANEEKKENLRTEFFRIQAQKFEYKDQNLCPVCDQPLPVEKVHEARGKALNEFNIRKATELEAINTQGKRLKASIEDDQAEITKTGSQLDSLQEQKVEAEKIIVDIQTSIKNLEKNLYEYGPEYEQLLAKIDLLQHEITALQKGATPDIEPIKKRIESLEADRTTTEEKLSRLSQANLIQQRIEELGRQERTLSAEYERLEKELYLTEEFLRSKVSLLEERINGKFKLAKFKLFSEQVNGGLKETCETTFSGVPYSAGLNHGAQINVGLDIIQTLSTHYGLSLPVWIDNAEAITALPKIDSQKIQLIVSEQDETLRIEKEKK